MTNPNAIVERYLEAFNETDATRRAQLLGELYTSESTYTDPHVSVRGPEQIGAFIEQTQERFPGYRFTLGGPIDAHHEQARFQWHAAPDGQSQPQYVGFDVIVTQEGKIERVYGFMDEAPQA